MDQCTHEVLAEYWKGIIRACGQRPAGQSAKRWMDENGICEQSYYYWQRKFRQQAYGLIQERTAIPAFLRMQGASSEQKWNSPKDAPMPGMPFAVKDRTLKTLYFQVAGRPSESVWHGGRMTVPVSISLICLVDVHLL